MFSNKRIAKFPKNFFKNKHHEHFDFAIDITDYFKHHYDDIKAAFLPVINEDSDLFKKLYFSYPKNNKEFDFEPNDSQEYLIILDDYRYYFLKSTELKKEVSLDKIQEMTKEEFDSIRYFRFDIEKEHQKELMKINRDNFEQTLEYLEKNNELLFKTEQAKEESQYIFEKDFLNEIQCIEKENSPVLLVERNCLQIIKKIKQVAANNHVAVINFTSAINLGEKAVAGGFDQESDLYRNTNLYFCLNQINDLKEFYLKNYEQYNGLYNDDVIYIPGITTFKDVDMPFRILKKKDWFSFDIINCSAFDFNNFKVSESDEALVEIFKRRIKRVLDVALVNKVDTVIINSFEIGDKYYLFAEAAGCILTNYKKYFNAVIFSFNLELGQEIPKKRFGMILGLHVRLNN